MRMTFRWFGSADPVPLRHIRQIPGMAGIVSALHDLPPGEDWPVESLLAQRAMAEAEALELRVIESIPVHEDIKLGGPRRDERVESWIRSMRAVAEALGPRSSASGSEAPVVITYNFMPVFDWMRSELDRPLEDGSTSLTYDAEAVARMDPIEGELALPGWLASYSRGELQGLLEAYRGTPPETVYGNLVAFLRDVAPEAERLGIKLALHPDDPPWPIFGIPRIMTGAASVRRLFSDVTSPASGLCLCAGSFGADPANDIPAMAREFAGRVHFAHLRNVKITSPGSFSETAHHSAAGSLDMAAIVEALVDTGYEGPIRPDHGRMIWGESGKPGYGLYDRALGASYLTGLIERSEYGRRRANGDRAPV
ncbi:MAG: mannonate dehydratase [Spirochaetes bacterium]|nr:mannonate dehydratase [Spirochaetota bacterium]